MKTVPARLRLIDFTDDAGASPAPPEMVADPAIAAPRQATEQMMSQAELDHAVSQARDEVEARAAQELQQVRDEYEKRLEHERLKAIDDQAEIVLARMTGEFAALGADMANRLFEKCRPVLGILARERAVAELAEVLEAIVQANCKLTVTGPGELLDALRKRLAEQNLELNWQEDQVTDISITVGETIVETQLSEWFGSMAETADG